MNETVTNLVGWVPAVILPVASLIQLIKIWRSRTVAGVSLMTWLLFGIANLGLYVFTEKYTSPQAIIGLLGTALINFVIVGLILVLSSRSR